MMKLQAKMFELNFLLKLSDLKSNFTLTLGYLNPALNNPGQKNCKLWGIRTSPNTKQTLIRILYQVCSWPIMMQEIPIYCNAELVCIHTFHG